MVSQRKSRRDQTHIWAGFVDVQSTLLIIFLFVLLIFMVVQNLLAVQLSDSSGRAEAASELAQNLSTDLSKKILQIKDLNQKVAQSNSQIAQLYADIDANAQSITALEASKEKQQALLLLAREQNAVLKQDINTLEQSKLNISEQLALTQSEQRDLQEEYAQLSALNQSLNAQVSNLEQGQQRLNSLIEARNRALEKAQADIQSLDSALTQKQQQLDQLQSDLLLTQDNLQTTNQEREQLEQRLKENSALHSDELSAYQTLFTEQNAEITRLKGALSLEGEKVALSLQEQALLREQLKGAFGQVEVSEKRINALLQDLQIIRDLRDQFQTQVASLQDQSKQQALQESALTRQVENQRALTVEAESKVNLVNQQLFDLRAQVAALQSELKVAHSDQVASEIVISNLEQDLNLALAQKVEALKRTQSDYLENIRPLLEGKDRFVLEGDRFVLQSEVLFQSGSDQISAQGRVEIEQLTKLMLEATQNFPQDFDWVLRVDGHTDNRPLASNARFSDNWDLSTARARSLVALMIDFGFPAEHLMAAGFADTRPIALGTSALDYQQNRRIEFKITEP